MDYVAHLSKDKKLAAIIREPLEPLHPRQNIPLRLMASIMSQQLSTKVAKVIYHRFLALFNGEEPAPQQVLATSPETLRAIGLSNAKVSYVHNVARFALEQGMDAKKLSKMSNEEVIAY